MIERCYERLRETFLDGVNFTKWMALLFLPFGPILLFDEIPKDRALGIFLCSFCSLLYLLTTAILATSNRAYRRNLASGLIPPKDSLLVADMPEALRAFLERLFPGDPVLQQRALLRPWGEFACNCAWDARRCWVRNDKESLRRRALYERQIPALIEHFGSNPFDFAHGKPFFVSEGTGGTMRSPFPGLSDAEYWWVFSTGLSEESARSTLLKPRKDGFAPNFLGFLLKEKHIGFWGKWWRELSNPVYWSLRQVDPRFRVWGFIDPNVH